MLMLMLKKNIYLSRPYCLLEEIAEENAEIRMQKLELKVQRKVNKHQMNKNNN